MKKLFLGVSLGAFFLASSVAGRAGTEMGSPSYDSQASAGYWVPPPSPAPPAYPYAPAYAYAPPPPYYYAPPPAYYGAYYGPGVSVYVPGIFFGFGFHGRR